MAKLAPLDLSSDHIDVEPLPTAVSNPFQPANVEQSKIRILITGASGSGKTYTSLLIARELSKAKIAVIDTEYNSAALYSKLFQFDTLNLTRYTPRFYVQAIEAAAQNGYDVCVVDSLTHSWNSTGGILEIAGNNIRGWKDATPQYQQLITALIKYQSRMHIICTLRSKMSYELQQADGKLTVKKIGLQPIHRDGLQYEFDCELVMQADHSVAIDKSRYTTLSDGATFGAGIESVKLLASQLIAWQKGD